MPKPHSESFAWREITRLSSRVITALSVDDYKSAADAAGAIRRIARGMDVQLGQGIHANPPLLVFGNPKGKRTGEKFSSNVLAVLYVHDDDGENYAHGFANAELDLETLDDGTVTLGGLPSDTDVEMIAQSDGSVLLRGGHGQRLWQHF